MSQHRLRLASRAVRSGRLCAPGFQRKPSLAVCGKCSAARTLRVEGLSC
jgi:hypothetical protein